MTAVSNPNNRPPRAATIVLFNKVPFSFMPAPAVQTWNANCLRPAKSSPQVITEQTSIHWTEARRTGEYEIRRSNGPPERLEGKSCDSRLWRRSHLLAEGRGVGPYGERLQARSWSIPSTLGTRPPGLRPWRHFLRRLLVEAGGRCRRETRSRASQEGWRVGSGNVGAHQPDNGGMGRADSVIRNKNRVAFKYAARNDPLFAAELWLAETV